MATHHDVFQDIHISKKFDSLKGTRDTDPGHIMGFLIGNVFSLKNDPASGNRMNPGNQIEQGGFSRPIRADDRFDLAGFNLKG